MSEFIDTLSDYELAEIQADLEQERIRELANEYEGGEENEL